METLGAWLMDLISVQVDEIVEDNARGHTGSFKSSRRRTFPFMNPSLRTRNGTEESYSQQVKNTGLGRELNQSLSEDRWKSCASYDDNSLNSAMRWKSCAARPIVFGHAESRWSSSPARTKSNGVMLDQQKPSCTMPRRPLRSPIQLDLAPKSSTGMVYGGSTVDIISKVLDDLDDDDDDDDDDEDSVTESSETLIFHSSCSVTDGN